MTRRQYRMDRRAAAAAETRDRLVKATFDLHAEQGIAATSLKQIAERADVSVGTAYHHFPTYEDAVRACGAYTAEHYKPPEAVLDRQLAVAERLEQLAGAYYHFYQRLPVLDFVRREQGLFEDLRRFVDDEEAHRKGVIEATLSPEIEDQQVRDVVAVLLDLSVFRALQRQGYDPESAARQMSEVATGWITQRALRMKKLVSKKGKQK